MFDCGLESCKQTNHMLAIAHFRVAGWGGCVGVGVGGGGGYS